MDRPQLTAARLDNIDYDYLKELIKHQTTPGTNKAVSIPGQGEGTGVWRHLL